MIKTIAVTFAGRKPFMEVLFHYIKKYESLIDEYHLYAATNNQEDLQYIDDFASENSFVRVFKVKDNEEPVVLWNECYKNSQDSDSIYIKLDDDIVYIDGNLFTDFAEFRKSNPQYPIIYPLIVNNSYMSWIFQEKMGLEFSTRSEFNSRWDTVIGGMVDYLKHNPIPDRIVNVIPEDFILCPVGWGDVNFAKSVHNRFLDCLDNNKSEDFKKSIDGSDGMELLNFPPVSINCCSWTGSGMKEYTGKLGDVWQDESWLSVYLPITMDKPNYIYFNSIVSHFSYYKQMQGGIMESNILERYNKIKNRF